MRALMFYGMSEKKDKSCSIKISRSFNITPPSQAWNPPFFFNPNSRAIGHTFMSLTSWKMTGDLYWSFYLDCLMLPMSNLDHLIVWSQLSVEKAVYIYISVLFNIAMTKLILLSILFRLSTARKMYASFFPDCSTFSVSNSDLFHSGSAVNGKKAVCINISRLLSIASVKLGPLII